MCLSGKMSVPAVSDHYNRYLEAPNESPDLVLAGKRREGELLIVAD